MWVIEAESLPSPCPSEHSDHTRHLRVALVQTRWHDSIEEHRDVLADGIETAARCGAEIVFLPELTMMRYLADCRPPRTDRSSLAESLDHGDSSTFFKIMSAGNKIFVNGSIFEKIGDDAQRGFNSSVLFSPEGDIAQVTRKMHIPVTAGYYEDEYFEQGPAEPDGASYPVVSLPIPGEPRLGMPTCWDEWFPETARMYALQGAELLSYPTAIGSEPDFPNFDTEPLWEAAIRGNAIANGLFMIVPNRYGNEGNITFYGSSFIADPFGRVLVQAPRDSDAVLIANLDLGQREDWLELFPFFKTRRPESYDIIADKNLGIN